MMTGKSRFVSSQGEDVDCRKRSKQYRPVFLLGSLRGRWLDCSTFARDPLSSEYCNGTAGFEGPRFGRVYVDSGSLNMGKKVERRWFVPGGAWSKGDDRPAGVVAWIVVVASALVGDLGDSGQLRGEAGGSLRARTRSGGSRGPGR